MKRPERKICVTSIEKERLHGGESQATARHFIHKDDEILVKMGLVVLYHECVKPYDHYLQFREMITLFSLTQVAPKGPIKYL